MADKPMQRAARLSKNMDIAKITEAIRLAGAQEVLHNCRDSLDCVLNRSLSEDGMQLSGDNGRRSPWRGLISHNRKVLRMITGI